MDLRNWEFYEDNLPLVGATVKVRDAVLTHPNSGTVLASTVTDSNGMWAFTGLTDTAKDVEVIWGSVGQYHRWIKGMTRHNTGKHIFTETLTASGLVTASAGLTVVGALTLPAGSVETADLAANAVTEARRALAVTGSPTTTSATYVDLTDMDTGSFTTFGGPLLVHLVCVVQHTVANTLISMALSLDAAAEQGEVAVQPPAIGQSVTLATAFLFTGVTAGSHRVKGRWSTNAATAFAVGTQRRMIVVELKK